MRSLPDLFDRLWHPKPATVFGSYDLTQSTILNLGEYPIYDRFRPKADISDLHIEPSAP